ncbi:MAG: NfeD family protein [Kiritimatiellia bacterium]|nr:nodulation efficiency protein D [Lentisphaerota bacterium]
METFILLLAAGLIMICAEVFLPGGILGALGGLALLGAVIVGFVNFGPATGGYIALALIIVVGAVVVVWIRFFPHTRAGQALTLSGSMAGAKSADRRLQELAGQSGRAVTDLRPAGMALIAGRKYDVISEGPLIQRNEPISVLRVKGNRVIVRRQE